MSLPSTKNGSSGRISKSIFSKGCIGQRISIKAIFALVFYVMLPTTAILLINIRYPELSTSRLTTMLSFTLPLGMLLIFISQFQVRYSPGNIKRLLFNLAYLVTAVFWVFGLLGGKTSVVQKWEEIEFSVDITGLLLLIFTITGINAVYYILEYSAFRKKNSTHETSLVVSPTQDTISF